MTTVQSFLDTNEITGALTPEQAAQLLELPPEGDTVDETETASAPAPAPAEPESSPAVAIEGNTTKNEADPADLSAENAAILAKDGKHLIPFDKLTEARDSAQRAAAERDEARRLAEELKAQLEAVSKPQPEAPKAEATKPEAVDLKELREQHYEAIQMGDKSLALELGEKIEAEVLRRAEAAAAQRLASERAQEQAAQAANELQRVAADAKAKYPALDETGDKADQDAIDFVVSKRDSLIQRGTAPHKALEQAVAKAAELFKWNGQAAIAPPKDAATAAAAAIAAAQAKTPATLSDIPGGKPAGQSLEARMASMNGPEMLELMSGMNREQIDELLNRTV